MSIARPDSGFQIPAGNLHPLEAQILALESRLHGMCGGGDSGGYTSGVMNTSQAVTLREELISLRRDVDALRQEHGGCVSATPGEICEHCVSVVQVRLRMIMERDRRGRLLPPGR